MQAFEALADPTRRRIVELLADDLRGGCSAGALAAHFAISRPAVSQHLRVLREAGMVHVRADGQRRVYTLDPAPLAELDAWLARYRRFWQGRLDDLEQLVTDHEEAPR